MYCNTPTYLESISPTMWCPGPHVRSYRYLKSPGPADAVGTPPCLRKHDFEIPDYLSRYVPYTPLPTPLPSNPHTTTNWPGLLPPVLDSSLGKPAHGIKVKLLAARVQDRRTPTPGDAWTEIGSSETNADGRCLDLLLLLQPPLQTDPTISVLQRGIYQIVFETEEYFERTGRKSFYPFVQVTEVLSRDSLS